MDDRTIEVTSPEELGLVPARLDELVRRIREEVDEGRLPSCQVAVARHGRVGLFETFGDATAGSRYRTFSAVKPVVASVVWLLIQEGALDPAQRVADVIPEFGANGKAVVTIEQVMLHTCGFPTPRLGPPEWDDADTRLKVMAAWPLEWEPGTRFEYHATSAHWVLAALIECVSGEDFRAFVRRRVIAPLGLTRLAVGVPAAEQADLNRLVAVGTDVTPDELEAALGVCELPPSPVTFEALMANETESVEVGVPGSGGVSTAADIALFYQTLLHNDAGLWTAETLRRFTAEVRNRFPDAGGVEVNRSLGMVIAGDDGKAMLRGFGRSVSGRTFGHAGAGGQLAWADPETGLSFGFVTNGRERNVLLEWRRSNSINTRAGLCAQ